MAWCKVRSHFETHIYFQEYLWLIENMKILGAGDCFLVNKCFVIGQSLKQLVVFLFVFITYCTILKVTLVQEDCLPMLISIFFNWEARKDIILVDSLLSMFSYGFIRYILIKQDHCIYFYSRPSYKCMHLLKTKAL